MTAANEVVEICDAGLYKRLLDILTHVPCWRAIKWQIASFGADYQLVSRESEILRQRRQGLTNRAFTSLKAVVSGRVDNIRPELNRANDCVCVVFVSCLIGTAQISAYPD